MIRESTGETGATRWRPLKMPRISAVNSSSLRGAVYRFVQRGAERLVSLSRHRGKHHKNPETKYHGTLHEALNPELRLFLIIW